MEPIEIDIESVYHYPDLDDFDVTINAVKLSRALIKLLHSTTNSNPEEVQVTLKFDFYSDICEIVEEI